MYMGIKVKRPWMGVFLGVLWFFMPNNLLALFTEGNLARSICMIFLPIFVFQVFQYLQGRNPKYLIPIAMWFGLMTMCHLGYAGMIALGMLIFFLLYGILNRTWRPIGDLIITIALCSLATIITRFSPFLIFSPQRPTPKYVQYLGKALPAAIFGMLVVYCLKNVSFITGNYGLPELIAIAVTAGLHLWRRQMLLSIAGGTACYMLLVQLVF